MPQIVSLNWHNKGVFDKLESELRREVARKVKKRSDTMLEVLRHRQQLVGSHGARYPKGDGSKNRNADRKTEPHSYTGWQMSKQDHLHYTVYNNHANKSDEFKYPAALLYGKPWAPKVKHGHLVRLVKKGDLYFSTQMPDGIKPWMQEQRALLIKDVKTVRRKHHLL